MDGGCDGRAAGQTQANSRSPLVTTGTKILLLGLLVIGLGVGGFFGIRYLARQGELGPFNDQIGDYTAPAARAKDETAYVKGKVIPVNLKSKDVDWLYYDLPDDLRPASPAEVGTVAWLDWGEVKVGEYGKGGGGAFVQTCKVTVIDKARRAIVGETVVRGSDPPKSSRRGASASGSKPTAEVVQYLRGLPRK
jgi:hypothetical protein